MVLLQSEMEERDSDSDSDRDSDSGCDSDSDSDSDSGSACSDGEEGDGASPIASPIASPSSPSASPHSPAEVLDEQWARFKNEAGAEGAMEGVRSGEGAAEGEDEEVAAEEGEEQVEGPSVSLEEEMVSLRGELDEAIDCLTEAEDRCVELAEELERVRAAKQVGWCPLGPLVSVDVTRVRLGPFGFVRIRWRQPATDILYQYSAREPTGARTPLPPPPLQKPLHTQPSRNARCSGVTQRPRLAPSARQSAVPRRCLSGR